MKWGTISCFAVGVLMLGISGAAAEDALSFPNHDKSGAFKNEAGVVVTKVSVNQQTSNGCDQVDKEHDANLADGDSFTVQYNSACDYEFHIEVKDCSNQEQHVSASDIQSDLVDVVIKGTCDALRTSKEVP